MAPTGIDALDVPSIDRPGASADNDAAFDGTSSIQLAKAEDPLSWHPSKKWLCTIVIVAMTTTISFCSSIHTAVLADVAKSFSCSRTVATLGVSTFLLGFAAGPLIFGPLSEVWGRNPIYRAVLLFFVVFNVGCALAPNIASLLIFRFFCGFFGSPTVTNSGGSLTDMWPASHRTVPLALFTAASFLGPVIAPIVGGFVVQYSHWRWNYWIVSILGGVSYTAMLAILPETYAPIILKRKRALLHKDGPEDDASPKINYYVTLTRPWVMLFTEPILFLLSLYMAFCYGILYLDFTAYPIVFAQTRGWAPGPAGLSFLGIGIGMALATACSPLINRVHAHYVAKLRLQQRQQQQQQQGNNNNDDDDSDDDNTNNSAQQPPSPPEARLPHLIPLSPLLPASLFWFAWTSSPSHHFLLPIAAGVPFGLGFVPLFLAITAYLADVYGPAGHAASALAANAVLRSLFGAAFPLFAPRMYAALGAAWATGVLGFGAVALAGLPWGFWRWGAWLRGRSGFYGGRGSGEGVV
ncbi:putative transporter C11D3.05 [Diplodia seriata]|uniref:Putative transporter C11D3.05 n=1 Tax=Diplodia seriata TaxID=420778 RepID=A0A1S8BG69_9PEZI|nr:putative transporter C11D3.05 [Diplodia seriata]